MARNRRLTLTLRSRRYGREWDPRTVDADPDDLSELNQLLVDMARDLDPPADPANEYELHVVADEWPKVDFWYVGRR